MKYKEALTRFSQFLAQAEFIFIQSGRSIHVDKATAVFAEHGVIVKRAGLPDRCIPYDRLNMDRLYSLVCNANHDANIAIYEPVVNSSPTALEFCAD